MRRCAGSEGSDERCVAEGGKGAGRCEGAVCAGLATCHPRRCDLLVEDAANPHPHPHPNLLAERAG